jgi:putative DNA methylase
MLAPQQTLCLESPALKDTPALLERVFPAQKLSAEAQKERKAGSGQTLTALGSYWKGRKPLILVRAIILGSLLPATDDPQADLEIFEKLMGIDEAAFGRRAPKLTAAQVAASIILPNPWDYFDYTLKGTKVDPAAVAAITFPLQLKSYPGLSVRWKRDIELADKQKLLAAALKGLSYSEKVKLCKRPEECDPEILYGPIWEAVNQHLRRFGIEAHSHEELVAQLGQLRFGHRPRVGDTFCGGGSIPFEAARLGCEVYASDLNPIACMLTWGALNIIGASPEQRAEIAQAQQAVAEAVDREMTALGIEHNERGDRAKAYLYCLETRCPETGWQVPLAPSWVISKSRQVYAKLIPNEAEKRFEIEIVSGASPEEMEAAEEGTVKDGQLVYTLNGKTYRTPIKTLRGDYRDEQGVNRNRLRQWEQHDFMPRPEDIFQERLYCIQWITQETLGKSWQATYFAAVTKEDLRRERQVEQIVAKNLARWQEEGFVPDMVIEPGDKTDEPIRTRGWRYWQQLFNARQLLVNALFNRQVSCMPEGLIKTACAVLFSKMMDHSSKLAMWDSSRDTASHVFINQALNTLYNHTVRSMHYQLGAALVDKMPAAKISHPSIHEVANHSADKLAQSTSLWITDPPYADAVHYHEITEYFIAWLRKNPPAPFNEWIWDSRRALAIQGSGDNFRRDMVEAYQTMVEHMPDNGLQCVMFTHQDHGVWSDMVSIFWAAGLQVVGAWYIATETSSELKKGGYVQGTVILILKKRSPGQRVGFKPRLLPEVRREVASQMKEMMHLNERITEQMGATVFTDSDLQMAGYAAALKVLTGYTEINGEDVTRLALRPRQKGEKTVVDDIVQQAAETANSLLVPEGLPKATWEVIGGIQRFYLRMLDMETTGAAKLDNYQNFAKAFRVENYQAVMASLKPNAARLKGAQDFKPRELGGTEIGKTWLGQVLIALQELLKEKEPPVVMDNLRDAFSDYFQQRQHLQAIAQFLHDKLAKRRPEEARAAEIIANRMQTERL